MCGDIGLHQRRVVVSVAIQAAAGAGVVGADVDACSAAAFFTLAAVPFYVQLKIADIFQ